MSNGKQHRNNAIVGLLLNLMMFLALIPLDWFHATPFGSISGANGSLGIPGTPKLPIWLLLSFSATAIGIVGLNLLRVTSIPRLIPIFGLLSDVTQLTDAQR